MGSYKSPAARAAEGQATLRPEDRPESVPPEEWLGKGEWITYWTQMPYGTAADIAEVATLAVMDTNGGNRAERRERRRSGGGGGVRAEYRAGRAAVATFVCGLVGWALFDETGNPVPFVPANLDDPGWYDRGKALMSALPGAVVDTLQRLIDSGSPPSLSSLPEDAEHEEDTEGNDSGAT